MGKLYRLLGNRGFLPTDIANLALWLDATRYGSLTMSSGRVSQWNDVSGRGNHVIQGTGSFQPLYGASAINSRPAVQFRDDGTPKVLSCADNSSFDFTNCHAFCVFQRVTDTGVNEMVTGKWNPAGNLREFRILLGNTDLSTTQGSVDGATTTAINSGTGPVGMGEPHIMEGYYNGSQIGASRDNSAGLTGSLASMFAGTASYSVGAAPNTADPYAGYVGEVLFYTTLLSAAQRTQVLNYLSAKWQITLV